MAQMFLSPFLSMQHVTSFSQVLAQKENFCMHKSVLLLGMMLTTLEPTECLTILCWSLQLSDINFERTNFRHRALSAWAKIGLSVQFCFIVKLSHFPVDWTHGCFLVSGRDEGFSNHRASFQGVCGLMAKNCVACREHRLNTCR